MAGAGIRLPERSANHDSPLENSRTGTDTCKVDARTKALPTHVLALPTHGEVARTRGKIGRVAKPTGNVHNDKPAIRRASPCQFELNAVRSIDKVGAQSIARG